MYPDLTFLLYSAVSIFLITTDPYTYGVQHNGHLYVEWDIDVAIYVWRFPEIGVPINHPC